MNRNNKNLLINNEIDSLKNQEFYSLLLFVLFKLRDNKEYSTLSELAYILEKEDFLNICEYFGGLTVKIPTIEELKELIRLLILYQSVRLNGQNIDDAINSLGYKKFKNLKSNYREIESIMEKYQFKL